MDKKAIIDALKKAKENSKKRNFKQTYDLIINLKDIDTKKVQINQYIQLHYGIGKKIKICALVGSEMLGPAKEVCDGAIPVDDFDKYSDKIKAKKLANSYDYFIAQATIMPKIATVFGRVFGPRGKMPNPKAGCVVPPNANLRPLIERLQKTIKLQMKTSPILQCAVGAEDMNEEEVADTISTIYESIVNILPSSTDNIRNVLVKITMGKPVRIGETKVEKAEEHKHKKK